MQRLKIIARYRDGRMVRGTTNNFAPGNPAFHVSLASAKWGDPPVKVAVNDLKAMFVVRDFKGDPKRPKKKWGQPGGGQYGHKLEVTFEDGEVMVGYSLNYDPTAQGFFVFPADPDSNNKRIFVVNAAVARVREC